MNDIYEIMKKFKIEIFYSSEDNGFIAKIIDTPEFEFISGFGVTQEEAIKELKWALKSSIESIIERGYKIPEPHYDIKKS